MVKLFKKIGSDISRFGKKVGGDVNKFVKKAGVGLSSAGAQVSKYAKGAEDVLNKVQSSPFGQFIPSPILGTARGVIQGAKLLGNVGRASKGITEELTSGKSAGKIAGNILERAAKIKEEGNKIKYA